MIVVNFLRGLFDANGQVSSKRVAGMEVLQVVIAMAIGSQFTKYKLDYAVLVSLLTFVIACFGMNMAETVKSMDVKKDVASNIVDTVAPGANEDAKDVLQADKP